MKTFDQNSIEETILNTWLIFTDGMENNFFYQNAIDFQYDDKIRSTYLRFYTDNASPELFELLADYYHSENTVSLVNKQKILENTFNKNLRKLITLEKEHIVENQSVRDDIIKYKKIQENHIRNGEKPDAELAKRIEQLEKKELYRVDPNSYAQIFLTEFIKISMAHCQNLELAMRNQIPSLEVKVQKNIEMETPEHSETRAGIKRILDKRYQPPIEAPVSSKGPTYG